MKRKRSGLCLAILALTAGCLTGCGAGTKQNEIELMSPVEAVVDIETVMYRDLYKVTTRDAELAPYTEELTFEAGGRIANLYVEVGSVVKAGDLLAEQDEESVRNMAGNALNKYLSEKKTYVDTVKAAKKKLAMNLTKEEREWQELLLAQAEELWKMQEPVLWSAWEEARAKVGHSQIFAPYDGVVTACLSEGTTVAAGQPVLAVADTERLYITVGSYLPPSEFENYEKVYALVNGTETEVAYVEELMEEEGTYTYYTAKELNGAEMGDFVITGYKGDVYVEIVDGLQEGDRVYVKN